VSDTLSQEKRLQALSPEKRALVERLLKERAQSPPARRVATIPRVAGGGAVPLTYAQRRLWVLHELEGPNAAYNVCNALHSQGVLHLDVLQRALDELVRRHQTLRTTFVKTADGAVEQRVRDDWQSIPIAIERVAGEDELRRRTREETGRPFHLERDRLLRVHLFQLSEHDQVLLIVLHHIVSDGSSTSIFASELSSLYTAFLRDNPSPLPELPIQFADYAAWEAASTDGSTEALEYWRSTLAGAPTAITLPVDRPYPERPSYSGAWVQPDIDAETVSQLRALSSSEDTTLFAGALAALNILLSRYSGQTDVVVGCPFENRGQPEAEGLIGFFVNTLPVRLNVSGEATFRQTLRRARKAAMDTIAHQSTPFERIVDSLRPERDRRRTPLFQVVLAYQNNAQPVLRLPGLQVTPRELEASTSKFELTFIIEERSNAWRCTIEYNAGLFDNESIQRMASCFVSVLKQCVAQPDRSISEFDFLTPRERLLLVEQWSGAANAVACDFTIPHLFEEVARRQPESVALILGDRTMTYAELHRQSDGVAAALIAHGVSSRGDAIVGLCAERSLEMIVAMLGILKAGAAYLPLDLSYPADRLAYMIDDAEAALILTHGEAANLNDARVLSIASLLSTPQASETRAAVTSHDAAYLMYTSGSTGQPKGVRIPHRAIVRLCLRPDFAPVDTTDTLLQLAPVSFDAATFEIWGALLNGAKLAIAPPSSPSIVEIGELIASHRVTTLWLTSSLFNLMVDERLADLSPLRQLLAGGEALSPPHVKRAIDALPDLRLINGYGPTENTTFTCCYTIHRSRTYESSIPIGKPVRNTTVYILDSSLNIVPIGVAGELYTGGDGLAIDYWKAPDLTAARFVTNPFGPGRLYRTGDLARWLPSGEIEFLGRLDEQIKIRGHRIEPGEIEAALLSAGKVRQAVVIAHEADAARKTLVAYVVSENGFDDRSRNELEKHLRSSLPDFMIPSAILAIDEIPLTPNGKVDRRRLPAPSLQNATSGSAPLRTQTEEGVAAVFCDVLRAKHLSAADSFFDCGGNSLLASQVVSRIRQRFGVLLPLRQIFDTPQVRALAQVVDAALGSSPSAPADTIPRCDRDEPLPLSFAQERLWFLQRLEPDNPFYNVAFALRIEGPLDASALHRSLRDLCLRHEVLRTAYRENNGLLQQQILSEPAFALESRVVADDALIEQVAREEARRPFDLATGRVMRATLLQVSGAHVLLLTIHHVAADGWSLDLIIRDLGTLYRGETPPELPIQYADFAVWQRRWMQGEIYSLQSDHWKKVLAGYPAQLLLPTSRPRPAVQTFQGSSIQFEIDAGVTKALRKLADECGATMFMALLAAFATVLSRYSGQDDLIIGAPIANRTRCEVESLIGFFVNSLPLRLRPNRSLSFRDFLLHTREVAMEAYANQDLPFERLVDEIQPERDLSRNPLFQVMFALQNAPSRAIDLPGLTVEVLQFERTTAQFDIVLDMWETTNGLTGVLEFSTELFDRAPMARLIDHLKTLIASAVAAPDANLQHLAMLTAHEEHVLLNEFNNVREEFPLAETLQQLFEVQADAAPERIAAEHGTGRISYAALEEKSNQIAHRLRALGIQRNHFVAVVIERGINFLAAVLGVLKSGAAFVPVDPSYPQERCAYMVSHCAARVVLTTRATLTQSLAATALEATCLFVDDDAIFAAESTHRPACVNQSTDRAYMLYTSGSTGVPKGAIIRHDGKINHIYGQFRMLRFHRDSVFLQSAPSSSDISVWQFLGPLLIGGRTVIADFETLCDPAQLWNLVVTAGITIIELVPAVMNALLEHVASLSAQERSASALEWSMVTGEAASPALVNRWLELFPHVPIVNAYGPTEAADDVCQAIITRPLPRDAQSVPIGVPLPNLTMYVLDRQLRLLPAGVPGEICVSGVGVGEGYWRDEAQTRESFVPNPYAGHGRGDVLYRTGDIGMWRDDGMLECAARLDDQVKIRGFRIELPGIEAALSSYSAVRDAAVLAREDTPGDKRLVAYVVLNGADAQVAGELERIRTNQLSLWQDLHDNEYRRTLDYGDPTFNVVGWDSNYDGKPISKEGMHEYVDHTVARILQLKPRRLLEIGCGTGLLMFPLLPHLEAYTGMDLSLRTIERLAALQKRPDLQQRIPRLEHAALRHARADQLSMFPAGSVDTIVFPSVIQYFPGAAYLHLAIEQAIRTLGGNGAIFFGDVKSLPLLDLFYASVQLFKAADSMQVEELLEKIAAARYQDQELALDPAFFLSLRRVHPAITQVSILPKRGADQNEMNRFRFDVAIRIGAAEPHTHVQWQSWEQAGRPGIAELRTMLQQGALTNRGLSGLPNARLSKELALTRILKSSRKPASVEELRAVLGAESTMALDPEELMSLGGDTHAVHLSFAGSGADGCFDAAFVPIGSAAPEFPYALPDAALRLANNPLHEQLGQALLPRVREFVKARLPHYMVPAAFMILEQLPLGPSGKVDRKSLPRPPRTETRATGTFIAPSTETERTLAAIWCQVLGRERCGLGEDFFDIGGHSLRATQVVNRIQTQLHVDLPLRAIFNYRTLEALASQVDSLSRSAARFIERIPDAAYYPASPAQRRLWVLSQVPEASSAYNMPASLLVIGQLDLSALEAAFHSVVQRHESLRTTFAMNSGELMQRVHSDLFQPVQIFDFSTELDPSEAARQHARADAAAEFDLAHGPLVRLSVCRLRYATHVLLFNIHHIVCDEWSMGVLQREVMDSYSSLPLPALTIQYRDFAAWQSRQLQGESGLAGRAYWLQRLQGELPVLDLPLDSPRPPVKTYNGRTLSFRFGALATAVREYAQRNQTTLFMTLLAAVKVLLHRYSGQTDLIVASPDAGRDHMQLEQQIGFYINTLALRDKLSPDAPFADFLKSVTLNTTEALNHRDYPFDSLIDALAVRRDPSRMPLCDVVVVMQNAGAPQFHLPGVAIKPFEDEMFVSKYDLHFVFEEKDGSLDASIVYNTDLFRHDRMERMATHLRVLVESILLDDRVAAGRLNILPPEERDMLLAAGNVRKEAAPAEPSVLDRFHHWVATTPHREAVSMRDDNGMRRALTYRELDTAAGRIGSMLRSRNVGPETFVGLLAERSIEAVAAILGILKAGGAYVPIDASYPAARISAILSDACAPVVLTTSALAPLLEGCGAEIVLLDGAHPSLETLHESHAASPHQAAYMIYTSGSTGKPKGVVVTHRNAARLFSSTHHWFEFNEHDVWTLFHSIAFDFSVWELWGALSYGGHLVIASLDVARSPDAFLRLLSEERVSVLNQTPSAFRVLMEAESRNADLLPDLRYVVFGGEALDIQSLRPWFHRYGDRRPKLINMYGITETTVHVTYRPITLADVERPCSVIGTPIEDLSLRIVDGMGELSAIGIPGEICVGGAGVARGYWRRSELTSQRFVPDPFSNDRLYRSGDLGRYLPDGDIEYLGRIDHQVKVRGFRVELGEIEAALAANPEVTQALVVAEPHGEERRIVAYIATKDAGAVAVLRQRLRDKLPDYMIPSLIVPVEEFPLTPHGKIDRTALAALQSRLQSDEDNGRTATSTEQVLIEIIAGFLRLPSVPLRVNFFDLGAHSLLLVSMHAAIEERLHCRIPLPALYQHPNVEQLAAFLSGNSAGEDTVDEDVLDRAAKRRAARSRPTRKAAGGSAP